MSGGKDPGTLEMVRETRAAPDRVFRALTDPAALMEWWGTRGGKMTKAQVDLRPGGKYRFDFRTPEGERLDVLRDYEKGWVEVLGYLIGWVIAAAGVFTASPGAEPKE